MTRALLSVAVLFVAWAFFATAGAVAGLLGLAAWLCGEWEYGTEQFRAIDRTAAAVIGWGSEHTVSAQCGATQYGGCRFCVFVRWLLEWRWPGHCYNQAVREGLVNKGENGDARSSA